MANIPWIIEKAREFQKASACGSLTVWITTNSVIFLKIQEYQTTLPVSWGTCIQDRKQHLELDMEQETSNMVPNWERSKSRLHNVILPI